VRSSQPVLLFLAAAAVLGQATLPAIASEQPSADASSLAASLETVTVQLPDGNPARVMALPPGMDGFLTPERIETCLATISEAGAWPEAWLVVQDENRTHDLVMRIRLGEDGRPGTPDPVFAAERRDWDVPSIRNAAREATGRRVRGRRWNLVLQGFSKRIDQRFVYRVPAGEDAAEGLMALLPEGSILREARSVVVTEGRHHTLALVLQEAEFLPSACDSESALKIGHVDTGKVLLVLAGAKEVVDTVDLTAFLTGPDGVPILPRYRCLPEDEGIDTESEEIVARFADRELWPLIRMQDADSDGRELEFDLLPGYFSCERDRRVKIGIVPGSGELRVLSRPER
jgi:hypothetical protein